MYIKQVHHKMQACDHRRTTIKENVEIYYYCNNTELYNLKTWVFNNKHLTFLQNNITITMIIYMSVLISVLVKNLER